MQNLNKERAEFCIKQLNRLLDANNNALENYENSEYGDTPEGQDDIETIKEVIAEIEEEIGAYEEYLLTGVYVARSARKLLKKAKEEKEAKSAREDGDSERED